MFNLRMICQYPWLWLLLIPVFAVTFFTYFRINKKYRRTRNRIISVVLHLIVSVMCVAALVNVQFTYEVYNSKNEIMILVDNSYSTKEEKDVRDQFVRDTVLTADPRAYKIGIMSFGVDSKLIIEPSNNSAAILDAYDNATETPDNEATDIAAAIVNAAKVITNKSTAKIVLVSDGIETDGSAMAAVRNVIAEGIRIDTVCLSSNKTNGEFVSLVSCETPDYNVVEDEVFKLKLTVNNTSSDKLNIQISLTDNESEPESKAFEVQPGVQTVEMEHSLKGSGVHSLLFNVTTIDVTDKIVENNKLYSYMLLNKYNKVLVIEGYSGSSEKISQLLEGYEVTIATIGDKDVPSTLEELRDYDEIILNNVSNADLQIHNGLDELLQSYVYEIGGGLFTVGGNDSVDSEVAHAYNRKDMEGSLYQQMLPVQVIDYTPPLGVYIILDISGSMTEYIQPTIDTAKTIIADSSCLTERDYCGIMTLSDDAVNLTSKPIPVTRQEALKEAIEKIQDIKGGNTNFEPSIDYAATELMSLKSSGSIEKMHIIVITDAQAQDIEPTKKTLNKYYDAGMTFSFLVTENHKPSEEGWTDLVDQKRLNWYNINRDNLTENVKNDLRVPEIKEVTVAPEGFQPKIVSSSTYASAIDEKQIPVLKGFYGTKARENTTVLYGDYSVPIYAEWKYGAGTVGSFMCDLSGVWSADFLNDDTGKKFLLAVVNKLFPTSDIRQQKIAVNERADNLTTNYTVTTVTELESGEKITMTSESLTGENMGTVTSPDESDGFMTASLFTKESGIYRVTFRRMDKNGNVVAERIVYKAFSYSEEYLAPDKDFDPFEFMSRLALTGSGTAQDARDNTDGDVSSADPSLIFKGFAESIQKNFDPRWLFMIIAITCFLIDIAVRKFKFRWIHEIIRDYKVKKEQENKQSSQT